MTWTTFLLLMVPPAAALLFGFSVLRASSRGADRIDRMREELRRREHAQGEHRPVAAE